MEQNVSSDLGLRDIIDKPGAVRRLIKESRIGGDFYFLLIISTLITTLGLIINSVAVVIGGMMIAPVLLPVLALGLGIVTDNKHSILRSSTIIIKSMGAIVLLSLLTAFIVGVENPGNLEIVQRIKPSLIYMYIAVLSGVGATYTWSKPKLSATLPGIAVSVALLPPLCVVGIGLSLLDRTIIAGSLQLFIINFIAISASSAVLFSLFGFHEMKGVEKSEIFMEEIDNKENSKKDTSG